MALEDLSHAELFLRRDKTTDPLEQQILAPFEHQAFAREYADENPFLSLGLLAAIPGYQALKALRSTGSRTGSEQPLDQIFAGYRGLGQGLYRGARRRLNTLFGNDAPTHTVGLGAVQKPTDDLL